MVYSAGMDADLSIRQVAQQTGLSIDTLRYYERIGLIAPVGRAPSGHRRYSQEDLDWIGLLIRLRETAMPLAQMIHFAHLRRQGPSTTTERRLLLEHHQHAIAQQMRRLEQHRDALHDKITRYKEREARLAASSPADDTTTYHER